ncbi:guanylate kinase [Desulfovibrio inopinatus]|uniref:guanylate kinase n=1 Tax=Desulfovibrio inopinatus TaxID=102109 RepID=UPI000417C02C|nr:guanylate kinase [Desulfovibrio inopinatus]
MKIERRGVILVICAPSGTGKSTLIKRLMKEYSNIAFSVSCTTRKPRAGEVDGKDYHFLDKDEFLRRRDAGFFAEWANVHDNFYGTPKQATLDFLEQGRDLLFDIDVQGANQLRQNLAQGAYIFIVPPSKKVLVERLVGRATDAPEVIARRLDNARAELNEARHFDYIIVNDVLELAYYDLRAIYLAERTKRESLPGVLDRLLAEW